ncbi:MAG: Tm-1-like ATP-binding domain-containing protein [Anaerolineales bacterium]
MKETIAIVATCDTKGEEAAFLRDRVLSYGAVPLVIDTGVLGEPVKVVPDVSRHDVASEAGYTIEQLIAFGTRGDAVERMREGLNRLVARLHGEGGIQGLIAIGGAEGALLGRSAMDALPFGVPKLTVSTIASGRHLFSDIIGYNDAMAMHSVIDILGINSISRTVFANAVAAVVGMVRAKREAGEQRPRIGISMLGTTTPPILRVVKPRLEELGYEVLTFHANGVGGACMDDLVRQNYFAGILDFSPNELVANLFGGLHQCKSDRMEPAMEQGMPVIVAPGSSSIIVLSREEALAEGYEGRNKYYHNPEITLVRCSREEMRRIGRSFAEKMNLAKGPVKFLYPMRGFSSQDKEGLTMYDPPGNEIFLEELRKTLRKDIPILEIDAHINDDEFAAAACDQLLEVMDRGGTAKGRDRQTHRH